MKPKQAKVFVRDATGLVRELTALDAYIIGVSVFSLGGAAAAVVLYLGLFPGSDVVWAFTLGLIPAIAIATVYTIQTAAFPRAGGDYVWVSRVAGYKVGFVFSWLLQFSYLFFINGLQAVFMAQVGLPSMVTGIGMILGAPDLIELGTSITSTPSLNFLVVLVFLVVGGLICILGVRLYSRIQRGMWLYGMLGMAVWAGLLLTSTHEGFVSSFNTVMSGVTSYEGIINAAASEGLLKPVGTAETLMAAIPLSWTFYAGYYYSIYAGGEIKNVRSAIPIGVVASLLTCYAFIVGIFLLSTNIFGRDFLYALSSLAAAGSPSYTLPFGPSISFLVSLLTRNPILLFITTSSLILWWFMILPPLYLAGSRVIFAWAYDRLIPTRLADVSERLHTPVLAITLCVVTNVVWAYLATYTMYMTWVSFNMLMGIGWAVPGFVAAAFPYVKKDLYERTVGALPHGFSRKIVGVPILTIAGLIQGVSMAYYAYANLVPTLTFTELSPGLLYAIVWLIVCVAAGLVYVLAVAAYRKRQGLDLNMIFSEIPPE
jgi:APA family basic amino acid/polyamine antiporter